MPPPPSDESASFPDQSIRNAYREARYRVNDFSLSIDEPHPAGFDAWLGRRGARSYAILTAENPRSVRLSPRENAERRATLLALLRMRKATFIPAAGEDPRGRWPREEGVCLLDSPPEAARALARIYDQHAIVEGELGGRPALYWL